MWPGQPEHERAERALADGIELPETVARELVALTGARADR
jgi:hypothetical protein